METTIGHPFQSYDMPDLTHELRQNLRKSSRDKSPALLSYIFGALGAVIVGCEISLIAPFSVLRHSVSTNTVLRSLIDKAVTVS